MSQIENKPNQEKRRIEALKNRPNRSPVLSQVSPQIRHHQRLCPPYLLDGNGYGYITPNLPRMIRLKYGLNEGKFPRLVSGYIVPCLLIYNN